MVVEELRGRGLRVFEVSAASGAGLRELTFAMAEIVVASREVAPAAEPERIVLRPKAVDGGDDFEVVATDEGWRVRGTKPERWVRQTDFSNEEAVGFLADRLNRLGVEVKLAQMGAEEGDTVLIGADDNSVVFDFKPSVEAGAEMLGRRGEDERLREAPPRPRPPPRHRGGDGDQGRGGGARRRRPPPRRGAQEEGPQPQLRQLRRGPDGLRDRQQGRPRLGRQ